MKRYLVTLMLMLALVSTTALALPRFSLMKGIRCGTCHINPTGGQMRNEYGVSYGLDKLPLEASRDSEFSFSAKLTDNISIGGDYRGQFLYAWPSRLATFQAMTTSLYGAVKISRKITFFFKQDIFNGNSTEAYGLIKILQNGGYLKGGTFMPDYGWKLDDHTAYTRGGDLGFIRNPSAHLGSIFVPNYKDIGVEVGGYLGDMFVSFGVFNGTGNTQPLSFDKDKACSGRMEYLGNLSSLHYRVGVSGYAYAAMHMAGVTLGLAAGNLVMYGEMDWTQHNLSDGANTMAAFAEADYLLTQGVWIIGRFDTYDPLQGIPDDDTSPSTNTVQRIIAGLEFFPFPSVELRPQYRYVIERPSIDNDVALVQLHIWF